MDNIAQFDITIDLDNSQTTINVSHQTETFDFMLDSQPVSLINNGDNSWSIVTGNITQETANQIGQAIETYYRQKPV